MAKDTSVHTNWFFSKDLPKPSVREGNTYHAVVFDTGRDILYLYIHEGQEEEASELFADIAAKFVKLHEERQDEETS